VAVTTAPLVTHVQFVPQLVGVVLVKSVVAGRLSVTMIWLVASGPALVTTI